MIHDLMTQNARSDPEADAITSTSLFDSLLPLLQTAVGDRPLHCEIDELSLPSHSSEAIVLLVNELVSNSLKHGAGAIEILLRMQPSMPPEQERRKSPRIRLEVRDEGAGFPLDFDWRKAAHTGLELIDSIGRWDLGGVVSYENQEEGGACVVTFPYKR